MHKVHVCETSSTLPAVNDGAQLHVADAANELPVDGRQHLREKPLSAIRGHDDIRAGDCLARHGAVPCLTELRHADRSP